MSAAPRESIDQLKKTIARLEKARDAALETARHKSEFLANMSHEIRTPLNAIIGLSDVLTETPLTPEQKKYVEVFRRAGDTLLNLINDILDLSKMESGRIQLEEINFDLNDLAKGVCELLSQRAREKNVNLNYRLKAATRARLIGDPYRLRQILLNLLGNAVKFTNNGDVFLDMASQGATDKEGKCLIAFAVRDTGIGIPADKISTIFEGFAQMDSSITRKYGGSGLGLSISKRLVERMGGEIRVESEVGKGTTFRFSIPFRAQKPTPHRKDAPGRHPLAAGGKPPRQRLLNVLLVDDSDDSRLLIETYLKKTGHVIDTAENGAVAFQKVKSRRYDVVFMDMQMPVMDGYAATRAIRQWETEKQSPTTHVIALTAHVFKEEVEKCLSAGCSQHLAKPIKKEKLLQTLLDYAGDTAETPAKERTFQDDKIIARIPGSIKHLIPRYLSNRAKDIDSFQQYLENQDFEAIATLCHNLKMGASFGFRYITFLSISMREAAVKRDADEVRKCLDELRDYLKKVDIVYE